MTTAIDHVKAAMREAPVNVERLIETLGLQLNRKAALPPEVAGEIVADGGTYTISANLADHYYRRRFTMAHELGHFLLHRDLIGDGVDDNRAYRSTDVGKFFNKKITPAHEAEANRFAASLLMPASLVRQEWDGDLARLSKKFQVSPEAMRYRIQSLDLL